jgi:hypothetical protein
MMGYDNGGMSDFDSLNYERSSNYDRIENLTKERDDLRAMCEKLADALDDAIKNSYDCKGSDCGKGCSCLQADTLAMYRKRS